MQCGRNKERAEQGFEEISKGIAKDIEEMEVSMNKEEIEKYYNEKIIAKENIDKEELIHSIVSVYTTMNNFEDCICDDMQDKVANIKQYIEQLENKLKELEENIISKSVIKEKIEEDKNTLEEIKNASYISVNNKVINANVMKEQLKSEIVVLEKLLKERKINDNN